MSARPEPTQFRSPLPIVAEAIARVIRPPPPMTPSRWMADNLVVPDGPRAGGRWDDKLTPYVAEIVDCLAPDSPHNRVVVRKSAQTGVSIAAIGLAGAYIAGAPCRIGYAVATIDAVLEFNREKLNPTIEQTDELRRRVRPQTSRSATGSTATSKMFAGGSLTLINANSAADLRSKTLKVGIADELDQWAADVDDQGDPLRLLEQRFTAFHATGDWRLLALSTPTLKGESRIDEAYQAGDQRKWFVTCPHCSTEITLEFKHLHFERQRPFKAHYVTQCCGVVIEHDEKARLVRGGRFRPTNPGGIYPSFHVDAMISQLTTWDDIARQAIESEGKERERKTFFNTVLGLPYEMRGDAPDHELLYNRREAYPANRIPPLGLLFTGAADVQHSGLWVELVAWGPDRQSWVIDARWLEGDTTDPSSGAFKALADLYDEQFEDAFGNRRRVDALAIDAGDGGRANQVYAFAAARQRAYAIKGVAGWGAPAIGVPTKVQITLDGKRLKHGAMVWPIGTWGLKAEVYDNLRKVGRKAGAELDPPGFCHFHEGLGAAYFQQLTAEHLAESTVRGRTTKVWQELSGRPNHYLDCRVYNLAMAEHLGLTRKTRDQWRALAQRLNLPTGADDLFAPDALAAERDAPAAAEERKEIADEFARSLAGKQDAPAGPRRLRIGRYLRR